MTNGVSRAQETASNPSAQAQHARAWLAAAVAVGVLTSTFVSGCEDKYATTTKPAPERQDEGAPAIGGATITVITTMPDTYSGKAAAVAGEVGTVYGPRAFTIGGPDWGGEILVIASEPIGSVAGRAGAAAVQPGDVVLTLGTVRRFNAGEMQKDVSGQVPAEIGGRNEGKPVIFARSNEIFVTPRKTGAAVAAAPADAGTGDAGPGVEAAITDVTMLLTAPDKMALVGRPVLFTDVRVQKVLATKDRWVAWVGPSSSQQILAVYDTKTATGKFDVGAGKTTAITGTVQRTPSVDQIRSEWHLSQADADAVKNQPVYIEVSRIALAMR